MYYYREDPVSNYDSISKGFYCLPGIRWGLEPDPRMHSRKIPRESAWAIEKKWDVPPDEYMFSPRIYVYTKEKAVSLWEKPHFRDLRVIPMSQYFLLRFPASAFACYGIYRDGCFSESGCGAYIVCHDKQEKDIIVPAGQIEVLSVTGWRNI